jgi:hypothetical protein
MQLDEEKATPRCHDEGAHRSPSLVARRVYVAFPRSFIAQDPVMPQRGFPYFTIDEGEIALFDPSRTHEGSEGARPRCATGKGEDSTRVAIEAMERPGEKGERGCAAVPEGIFYSDGQARNATLGVLRELAYGLIKKNEVFCREDEDILEARKPAFALLRERPPRRETERGVNEKLVALHETEIGPCLNPVNANLAFAEGRVDIRKRKLSEKAPQYLVESPARVVWARFKLSAFLIVHHRLESTRHALFRSIHGEP